jgi:hemolysin III
MLKQTVSPWPHAVGFFLSLLGLSYLVVRFHREPASLAAMMIYGFGLVAMFGASALYHWLGGNGPRLNAVLRRVDHASIYVMIAGSCTPVFYFGLSGTWRSACIASVWLLAAVGVTSTIWFVGAPRALSTAFYVALGWLALVPSAKLAATLSPQAMALTITGGILYSIGGVVYATRSFDLLPGRFGFHEVFHVLVVAGAAVQFAAIAFHLAPS